jgi:hypothetical protein
MFCFVEMKDNVRSNGQANYVKLPAAPGTAGYEDVTYETFNLHNNQIRQVPRKSFTDSESYGKREGVIYYYYVMKRVR